MAGIDRERFGSLPRRRGGVALWSLESYIERLERDWRVETRCGGRWEESKKSDGAFPSAPWSI